MLALAMALALAAPATPQAHAAPLTAGERHHASTLKQLREYRFEAQAPDMIPVVVALAKPVLDDANAGDAAQAAAHTAIGYSHYYSYDYTKAVERLVEARRLYERAGRTDTPEYASLVSEIGSCLTALGKYADAIPHLELGIAKAAAISGTGSQVHAGAVFSLGNAKFKNGDLRGGIALFQQAADYGRANERAGKPDENYPVYLMSLAALLDQAGEMERSLTYATEAVSIAEKRYGPDHGFAIAALHNLGSLLSHANRYGEAEPVLRRALDERATKAPNNPDTARTMHNLAKLLQKTGRYEEADALYAKAIVIFEAHPDVMSPQTVGEMQLNRAVTLEARGDLSNALDLRRAALARLRKDVAPDDRSVARGEFEVARNAYLLGNAAEATAALDRALPILAREQAETEPTRFAAAVLRATLRLDAGDRSAARTAAVPLATAIERELLTPAAPGEERADRWTRYQEPMVRLATLLLRLEQSDPAYRIVQLAQTAEIGEAANRLAARLAAGDGDTARLLRQFQDDDEAVRALATRINAAVATGDIAVQDVLHREQTALRDRMAAASAHIGNLGLDAAPTPRSLTETQAGLAKGEATLHALPIVDGVLSVLVTDRGLTWTRNAIPHADLVAAIAALRASTQATPDGTLSPYDTTAAHQIYTAITPDRTGFPGIHHLQVQASGALASVPFGALLTRTYTGIPANAPYLLRKMAISVPLPTLAQEKQRDGTLTFAGIGDPALAGRPGSTLRAAGLMRGGTVDVAAVRDLPRLPGAGEELRRMLASFGGHGALWTDANATESAIKSADLGQYRVLAFATHGLIGGDVQGLAEPALVLTPPATGTATDDGLLTASEIAQLRLDADWVILSACNTAAPSGATQSTYSGLARAFVQAGARSLLLSHWPVRDDAAARLTVDTVRDASGGRDRAQALRHAQLALIADKTVPDAAHPAIWAPYVLMGR